MKLQYQAPHEPSTSNNSNGNGIVTSAVREPDANSPPVPRIVVIGCSGHARVVVDILEENRSCVVGLLDTYKAPGTDVLGYKVLGSDDDLPALRAANICDSAVVAIGDNWVRSRMVERIRELAPDIRFVSAIHPSARIARDVSIGVGTVIMAGVVVNTGCRIGDFCILNTSASLDHDSTMGQFSSLAPRAVTGGGVEIGAFTVIAIGAVVSHAIRVGAHAVVGAGATVVKNVPDRVVAYGTPARTIRERNPGDPYLGERSNRERALPGPLQAPVFVDSLKSLTLIPSTSSEWSAYLERTTHDFFHTAEYHQVAEAFRGKAWLAVYGSPGKFVAWPYILQDIDVVEGNASASKLQDISSVYGYAGPLACGCVQDTAFLASAWNAMVEAWLSQSAVSAFTRFHPLMANQSWIPHLRNDGGTAELADDECPEGKTVAIDLSRSEAETWASYKKALRQAVRRTLRFGVTTISDPQWKYLDDFVHLYYRTMKRNDAAPFYLFPRQYFCKLKEALGSHGSLMVARYMGEVIAAALLIEYAGIVNVHLLATDDRFVQWSPSKLVIHEAQVWARARGNRFLHLGGGRGSRKDDPLFRFKSLFSNAFYPFHTGRWILNREEYDRLTAERQKQSKRLGRKLAEAHFPAYRAPFHSMSIEKWTEGSTPSGNPEA
jgi:sugar O-acyltransferase (sialic acid O-acetyltransferase NeuD family)